MKNIQWIWSHFKKYKKTYVAGIAITATYNILHLLTPILSQRLIDMVYAVAGRLNAQNQKTLFYYLLAMVGVTFIKLFFGHIGTMCFIRATENAVAQWKEKLFLHLYRCKMSEYVKYDIGELVSCFSGDITTISQCMSWDIKIVVDSVVLLSVTVAYFSKISMKVTFSLCVLAPVVLLLNLLFFKSVEPKHRALRESLDRINSASIENIGGKKVIKAFCSEDREIEKFCRYNKDFSRKSEEALIEWLKYFPGIEFTLNALQIVLILVSSIFIVNGELTYGEYVAFSALLWGITNPMRFMGNVMNDWKRCQICADRLRTLEQLPEEKLSELIKEYPGLQGKIEFSHVYFSINGKQILKDVSFTILPGMLVTILGESGSGKSTLFMLLLRFYEPDAGTIRIDDVDISRIPVEQLRRNIGLATQTAMLFSDTIQQNVLYGTEDNVAGQEERVKESMEAACASDFVSRVKDGEQTVVGERGAGLSGGQKQRLALARALAVKPAILLLDDTTSAVDLATEKRIRTNLEKWEYQCTKLLIVQRVVFSTQADLILVMQDGKIIEAGKHEELVAAGGYYEKLNRLQTGGIQMKEAIEA